jgi:ubiquinone/menaquinone biosynthesis C-methylase UbiE
MRRIKKRLVLNEPVEHALDVGCGTGLSTIALREIAGSVVGVDSSAEMIALASKHAGIEFEIADAEHLPFEDRKFDLVTVSQAIHWFDGPRFLQEARRVTRAKGWLIVYDNYFAGGDNGAFKAWHEESYLARYPSPPRAWAGFSADSEKEGFHLIDEEVFRDTVSFSLDGLINYFVTQSNIIAAVEGGKETIEETRAWLKNNLTPFFTASSTRDFFFNAPIWYLQRSD